MGVGLRTSSCILTPPEIRHASASEYLAERLLASENQNLTGLPDISGSENCFSWPKISSQTKPWTRWWWLGSVGCKEDFTAAMEMYAEAGFGGLEITPIYGVRGEESQFRHYLSPEWMELLDHVIDDKREVGPWYRHGKREMGGHLEDLGWGKMKRHATWLPKPML